MTLIEQDSQFASASQRDLVCESLIQAENRHRFLPSLRQDNHWAHTHTHSPGLAVCVIISLGQQVSGVGSICDRTQRYFAMVKCAIVCVMSSLSVSLLLCLSFPLPMNQTPLYYVWFNSLARLMCETLLLQPAIKAVKLQNVSTFECLCLTESRWPGEETGGPSLPFWCHVSIMGEHWEDRVCFHFSGLFNNLFSFFFSHWSIFMQFNNVWNQRNLSKYQWFEQRCASVDLLTSEEKMFLSSLFTWF